MNGKHSRGKHDTVLCGTERAFWSPQSQVIFSPKIAEENEPRLCAVSGLMEAGGCLPLFVFPAGFALPGWVIYPHQAGQDGRGIHIPCLLLPWDCSQSALLWGSWKCSHAMAKGSSEPVAQGRGVLPAQVSLLPSGNLCNNFNSVSRDQ